VRNLPFPRVTVDAPTVASWSRQSRQWGTHHVWIAVAAVLTAAVAAGSVFAATSVAAQDADTAQKTFERSSSDIAWTLQQAISHENDLVVNTSAYVVDSTVRSQTSFRQWTTSAQVLQRYPELQGMGLIVLVTAAELPTFARQAALDPARSPSADGPFSIVPPGPRPFYCLAAGALSRSAARLGPAGLDSCQGSTGSVLLASRDSGLGSYQPFQVGDESYLGIETPVYSGGITPSTTQARRASFIGWVGTLTAPTILLARALSNFPGTTAELRYHVGTSDVIFSTGPKPEGTRSFTNDLHNGWTVTTASSVDAAGVFNDRNALALLTAGIGLSVLLGLFVFMLGTGRERARRLVDEQTGQLRHQALHDALTDLPNRALVTDRIEQLLARNRRSGTTPAALFMDLDNFKNVNDTLGHQAGDRLLKAVAARLASTLRDTDTVGRMGGDEFVVLIDGASPDPDPQLVAERLVAIMRQPFHLDDESIPLVANISVGIASGDRASADELLRDADVALYQAKTLGKNRFETFDSSMHTMVNRRLDLEFDLRSALVTNQYRLVYQPIYNLADLTVVGVEALLRWDHPTRGVISPDEFIPILEQSSQIREVGRWVLFAACEQMAAWHAKGDHLDISVNVSGRQLDHASIVTDISDALAASGLDGGSLIVEVTETALMRNAEVTARRLSAIKEFGVRIAVDDFGTGYSSLAYLRQFPVDCLKIDRMFIQAVAHSPESTALIRTLVQLGRDLGLTTLAEGVETTDEMDLLRRAHVDQAQGFLMARPLDALALEAQLLRPTRPTRSVEPVSDGH
jgi:diguanylate cyclase (GGDEF)-like protein